MAFGPVIALASVWRHSYCSIFSEERQIVLRKRVRRLSYNTVVESADFLLVNF